MQPSVAEVALPSAGTSAHGRAARRRTGSSRRGEGLPASFFLSPWLLGFLGITALPMLASLVLSFTDYELLDSWSDVKWVGFANYKRMFADDPHYWHSVGVTLRYALIAVPLKLSAALGVALLLRRDRRGNGLFRGL